MRDYMCVITCAGLSKCVITCAGGEFQVRVTSDLQTNGQFWVELVRDTFAEDAYQHMLSQFK